MGNRHVVCADFKCSVNIRAQILEALVGQGKDEIHRHRFKPNGIKRRFKCLNVNLLAAKNALVLRAE